MNPYIADLIHDQTMNADGTVNNLAVNALEHAVWGAIVSQASGNGAAGSAVGYGMGKVVQTPLNKIINPTWKNWGWVDMGMGISKPLPLNPLPSISGNIAGAGATEGVGQTGQQVIDLIKDKSK